MSTKHTPTPWKVGGAVHVYSPGPEGGNVCSMSSPYASRTVGYSPAGIGDEEAFANAEFIVRAVNSHEALVDLAKQFRRTVEFYAKADERKGDNEGATLKRITIALIDEALALAEAQP